MTAASTAKGVAILTETSSAKGVVISTKPAERGCHPDEASNASGWKDLGQLRASEAGTGFEMPHPMAM